MTPPVRGVGWDRWAKPLDSFFYLPRPFRSWSIAKHWFLVHNFLLFLLLPTHLKLPPPIQFFSHSLPLLHYVPLLSYVALLPYLPLLHYVPLLPYLPLLHYVPLLSHLPLLPHVPLLPNLPLLHYVPLLPCPSVTSIEGTLFLGPKTSWV